ncbi:hypothetical protein GCM10017771_57410 [Streptomyces capitiformicae]|uniref:Transposase n=1 Tax=Streptomyces capitiformicae TaxID=2014920 RepID=A0A918Z653_9ACTN|nr:hypothetical protein GCM10017771_57410 [Streptomyces capitiformicae]
MGGLRELAASFVVPGPSGVAIRTRLKHLTAGDEKVLRLVGDLLGSLASRDLKARCSAGLEHDTKQWAQRKRALTGQSSSRWAGSITKATHDQWALARRGQLAHIQSLQAGIETIAHRLSVPVGEKGTRQAPGGYRSTREWFAKSRRLCVLEDRLQAVRADREAGVVRVVRGGKRLLNTRHHLQQAQLTEEQWRLRWQAGRRFLAATASPAKGSATRRSASPPAARSRSSCPRRWRTWRTPRTAGTSWPPGCRSRTGVSSGPTASPPTGPWPTASTKTQPGDAGM